jgi:hypothetical protein
MILVISFFIEYSEDVVRFLNCVKSIPDGFYIICVGFSTVDLKIPERINDFRLQTQNSGKAKMVNTVMSTSTCDWLVIADGDILFPSTFLSDCIEMSTHFSDKVQIVTCDQLMDRRHSSNVPTHGSFRIMKGLAGGVIVCKRMVHFPEYGKGYQPEDVGLGINYKIGICPNIKVTHPWVESIELKTRQQNRLTTIHGYYNRIV